ncbi:hypothetical protein [Mycobacterium sp. ZZG]
MIDERRDGFVTWLTLDRPERLNAFTADGYRDLRIALQRLAGRSQRVPTDPCSTEIRPRSTGRGPARNSVCFCKHSPASRSHCLPP